MAPTVCSGCSHHRRLPAGLDNRSCLTAGVGPVQGSRPEVGNDCAVARRLGLRQMRVGTAKDG